MEKEDRIYKENSIPFTDDVSVSYSGSDSHLNDRVIISEYADDLNLQGLAIATEADKHIYPVTKVKPHWAAMFIMIVEFAERGSYFALTGVLTNFIMRPLPVGSTTGRILNENQNAGALGLGARDANALTTLMSFLGYTLPLFGGWLADSKIGRFKAVWYGAVIGVVSHVLFVIAALPSVISSGQKALAPLIIGILTLSFCAALIKPNLFPLLLYQYPYRTNVLKRYPDGQVYFIDRDRSIESLTLIYYWCVNIGAFLQLASSYAAKDVGYWLAFLIPAIMYMLVIVAIAVIHKSVKKEIPQGSILSKVCKVFWVNLHGNPIKRIWKGEFWSYAYPQEMFARGEIYENKKLQSPISWTKQDVLDYKSCILQSAMCLYWIPFTLNDGGLATALNSQAGAMVTKNVPNDLFNNFNQVTIVVFLPILDYIVYPFLTKHKVMPNKVIRCFIGFIIGSLASVVAAILQYRVYSLSECGWYASTCDVKAPITAWYEVIIYALGAIGECFCATTINEILYNRAPESAKGLVMSLYMLTNAFASAIIEGIGPAMVDPYLIWPNAAMACLGVFFAFVFLWRYWNLESIILHENEEREQERKRLNNEADGITSVASCSNELRSTKSISFKAIV